MRTKGHCFNTTLDITSLLRQNEISGSFQHWASTSLKTWLKDGDWSHCFKEHNAFLLVNKWLCNPSCSQCDQLTSKIKINNFQGLQTKMRKKKTKKTKTYQHSKFESGKGGLEALTCRLTQTVNGCRCRHVLTPRYALTYNDCTQLGAIWDKWVTEWRRVRGWLSALPGMGGKDGE